MNTQFDKITIVDRGIVKGNREYDIEMERGGCTHCVTLAIPETLKGVVTAEDQNQRMLAKLPMIIKRTAEDWDELYNPPASADLPEEKSA